MANQKSFEFPAELLEKINEMSSGGYFIMTFDEYGEPQINASFDSIPCALAAQYFLLNWAKSVDEINMNNMIDGLVPKKRRKKD